MNHKLLVVCGPTATGKTKLALHLSKLFDGEIVSVDSRQVYRGMDIGTGKDLPKGSRIVFSKLKLAKKPVGYYQINGIKLWGYDLVSPKDEFSVSQFAGFANLVIGDLIKRAKLPVLVGGTGLYLKAVVDGISTIDIPRSPGLREKLGNKTVSELFEILAQLDPMRAGSMNASDKGNPRRLIRAIEIGEWNLDHKGKVNNKKTSKSSFEPLFIGLSLPRNELFALITKRVEKRLKMGMVGELEKLLKSGLGWQAQSMASLGYRQWQGYFTGQITKPQTTSLWVKEEQKYALRQLTWFKKDNRINWFDVSKTGWLKKVEKLVKRWYA